MCFFTLIIWRNGNRNCSDSHITHVSQSLANDCFWCFINSRFPFMWNLINASFSVMCFCDLDSNTETVYQCVYHAKGNALLWKKKKFTHYSMNKKLLNLKKRTQTSQENSYTKELRMNDWIIQRIPPHYGLTHITKWKKKRKNKAVKRNVSQTSM